MKSTIDDCTIVAVLFLLQSLSFMTCMSLIAAYSVGVQREHCFLVLDLFQLRLSLICIICSFFCFYVTENIHDAPYWQLILILEACHSLQYRNIKLFSAVADYVNSIVCLLDKRQVSLRPSTL